MYLRKIVNFLKVFFEKAKNYIFHNELYFGYDKAMH